MRNRTPSEAAGLNRYQEVLIMETIDGVINLHKPVGITSAKALYKVRAITRMRKSGHTGTLDPGASGVLVLCVGKATKLVEQVMNQPKVYRAKARLDVTSESFDSDRPHRPVDVRAVPSSDAVRQALAGFEGDISQTPPAISAIKVKGVPAYKLAGKASAPVLKPRQVHVYWTHLHAYDWPVIDFEVCCGRGTYIRALIRDLGEELGTGGCLTELARLAVGPFHLEAAWTLESMATAPPATFILPLADVIPLLNSNASSPPALPYPSRR